MHFLLFLLLVSFVSCNDNKITFSNITAKQDQFPYVVVIRKFLNQLHGEKNWCGGILYSAIHVLTAAKCVAMLPYWDKQEFRAGHKDTDLADLTVYAGTINADGSGGESRKIKRLISPPWVKFKVGVAQENMVIFVLKEGFQLSLQILTAPMMYADKWGDASLPYQYYMMNQTYCLLPGWGMRNTTKHKFENRSGFAPAKTLQVAKFRPIPTSRCKTFLCGREDKYCGDDFPFSYDGVFCGLPVYEEIDTCDHDEGSPLVCDGRVVGMVGYVHHVYGCSHGAPTGIVSIRMIDWFIRYSFRSNAYLVKATFSIITLLAVILNLQ